jgi:hypothetical protein
MPICPRRSLDGFGVLHSKLFQNVFFVLCLVDKDVIFQLLDWKPKKYFSSPVMDISTFLTMIQINTSQEDLLVDANIISST